MQKKPSYSSVEHPVFFIEVPHVILVMSQLFFRDFIHLAERERGKERASRSLGLGRGKGKGRSTLPAEQSAWNPTRAKGRGLINGATQTPLKSHSDKCI